MTPVKMKLFPALFVSELPMPGVWHKFPLPHIPVFTSNHKTYYIWIHVLSPVLRHFRHLTYGGTATVQYKDISNQDCVWLGPSGLLKWSRGLVSFTLASRSSRIQG